MASPVEIPRSLDDAEKAKTLIGALNLISRNLPLPSNVFSAVSSIYLDVEDDDGAKETLEEERVDEAMAKVSERERGYSVGEDEDSIHGVSTRGTLISEFEDALVKQQNCCASGLALRQSKETRLQSLIQARVSELEDPRSFNQRNFDIRVRRCLGETTELPHVWFSIEAIKGNSSSKSHPSSRFRA